MAFGKQHLRRILSCLALAGFLYLAVCKVILPLVQQGAARSTESDALTIALAQFAAGLWLFFQLRRSDGHDSRGNAAAAMVQWLREDMRTLRASRSRRELAVVFLPFFPLLAGKIFSSTFLFFPLLIVYVAGCAYIARECFWRCVAT